MLDKNLGCSQFKELIMSNIIVMLSTDWVCKEGYWTCCQKSEGDVHPRGKISFQCLSIQLSLYLFIPLPALRWFWDFQDIFWCVTPSSNKGSDLGLLLLIHHISYCSSFFLCPADHAEFQRSQCGEEQVQWWNHCGWQVPRVISALCWGYPHLCSRHWNEVRSCWFLASMNSCTWTPKFCRYVFPL